jgi:ribulose-5-phosphate 4-epimerase/fuculose-1-phosphate aldolase
MTREDWRSTGGDAMNERVAITRIGGVALERKVSAVEQKLRLELAAVFRIAHHLGWNVDTLNHISLRIPGTDTFLMNPQGLGWDEMTASSLSTLDYSRNVLSHSGLEVQPAGYNFHSGILKARPDVDCVMHVHETAGTAIGAIDEPEPLVILSQGGCRLYQEVGYHGFEGLAQEEDEVPRMLADLGPSKHTLIMRNHGLLSIGATLGEAFGFMRALIDACKLQVEVMATGRRLKPIPPELQAHTKGQMNGRLGNAPREDISWAYWLRLAERLDPAFAD